jgi:hypothetical protein
MRGSGTVWRCEETLCNSGSSVHSAIISCAVEISSLNCQWRNQLLQFDAEHLTFNKAGSCIVFSRSHVCCVSSSSLVQINFVSRSRVSLTMLHQFHNFYIKCAFSRCYCSSRCTELNIILPCVLLNVAKKGLRIQSVPQREHHTSPLQRSTG